MIKSLQEYEITKQQTGVFERALRECALGPDTVLAKLEHDAIEEQLKDLQAEMKAWEDLQKKEIA